MLTIKRFVISCSAIMPEYTLHKACKAFHEVTGMDFEAMGELEYYTSSA